MTTVKLNMFETEYYTITNIPHFKDMFETFTVINKILFVNI